MFMFFRFVILVFLLGALSLADKANAKTITPNECALEIDITGTIGAATLDYIQQAKAQIKGPRACQSILMLINTPGGSLQSTRLIVEEILNSPVPFLCLVYPSGGHAGSAGAIILQACHVSGAMLATNIGAATPVAGGGQEMSEDLRKKIFNDTISWLEGITKLRKRDLKFSKDIITDAKAVDAEEALKLGAIDYVAKDKMDFLNFAHGRKVTLDANTEATVMSKHIDVYSKGLRTQMLELIADPQIAYMMFMGSLGLLYFELTHPGTMVPGVIGGIGLVLSMISMHKLNVEWGAVALMLLGIALLIAEAFVASFGILGLGGVASFVLGSLFLFDPAKSGHSLPVEMVIPTALVLGLGMLVLAYMAFNTRKVKKRGGFEDLVGNTGVIKKIKKPGKGQLEMLGETWTFAGDESLAVGDEVLVKSHKGFTLIVEKQS